MTPIVVACDTVPNLQAQCVDAQFRVGNTVYYLPIEKHSIYYSFKKNGFVSHTRAGILSGVSVEYNTAWQ